MLRFNMARACFGSGVGSSSAARMAAAAQTGGWFRSRVQATFPRWCATAAPEATVIDGYYRPIPRQNASVANWLYVCAAAVAGVVWFGGVTRLTESGLSIVEWKPIAGVRPPLTAQEWEAEFKNYQKFPEFRERPDMTLSDFQFIFFWEWAHRVLARSLGVVFGVPLVYYAAKGRFRGQRAFLLGLCGLLGLGGAQGFMGWYMVRSGLDEKLLEERRKVTVSPYRLASHLLLAFLLYSFMLRMANGLVLPRCQDFPRRALVQGWARLTCGVMFVTAMTGAFVAGLDAGLLYNDGFPFMAGGILPPMDHLVSHEPLWRNLFENHAAVQAIHRLMAGATFLSAIGLNVAASRRRGFIPRRVFLSVQCANAALLLQVVLGMWTIISSVDIPVAASHQCGALLLLATLIRLCAVVGSRGLILPA